MKEERVVPIWVWCWLAVAVAVGVIGVIQTTRANADCQARGGERVEMSGTIACIRVEYVR